MADSLDRLNEQSETALLRFVAANYMPKLCMVYQQVRLPFVVADYVNLSSYGFPGVKSLRWNINSDYAEVDYYIVHIIQPDNKTERLI
jgi:hypothetical protein